MTPAKITYQIDREAMLTRRDVKLILRLKQLLNQRGQGAHTFTLIVHADETWELIPPPPKAEKIG